MTAASEDIEEAGYPPIRDYAVVGDCRTAALVSRSGSVDWLCLPRFDSPSIFAAILDRLRGGRFRLGPVEQARVERRYVGETNVLETTSRTPSGSVRLTDFMPVTRRSESHGEPWPEQQLLRRIECLEGSVEVELLFEPRPGYGKVVPRVSEHGALGFWVEHAGGLATLRTEIPASTRKSKGGVEGRRTLVEGEEAFVSFSFDREDPAVMPPLGQVARERLDETLEWWRKWASRCSYEGPHREAVIRSALVLKLLSFAPSGAVVASVTSSLPEALGGSKNWDYRYCWLRDASWTLRALFDLEYEDEAEAFFGWLMHATRLTEPDVQTVYDVYGRSDLDEEILEELEGYRGSAPVRVGNGAHDQFQLDVYGEVVSAAYELVRRGGRLDPGEGERLVELGELICERWSLPDDGIWESRAPRRHHVYSKVMCWIALDRLLCFPEAAGLEMPRERFERTREEIRAVVERRGWDDEVGSYVAAFGAREADGALLRLATTGYREADDPRMVGTHRWVLDQLRRGRLVDRYQHSGDGPKEGAFALCSFWDVEVRALRGDEEDARERFERLLELSNDVGLYSEEIDPESGAFLGNFPQAFTHVGLVIAAFTLASAAERSGQEGPKRADPEPGRVGARG